MRMYLCDRRNTAAPATLVVQTIETLDADGGGGEAVSNSGTDDPNGSGSGSVDRYRAERDGFAESNVVDHRVIGSCRRRAGEEERS